ncbi:MAG: type II and III secretion system protein [Pirellulaceae bacterium]
MKQRPLVCQSSQRVGPAKRIVLLAIAAGLIVAGGCQSTPTPKRRPLREIIDQTIRVAEEQQLANQQRRKAASQLQTKRIDDTMLDAPYATQIAHVTLAASGPVVDEIFEETDIREAIQSLASQASVGVIVDDQVAGVVTAVIENTPFEQALNRILLPLGYIWGKKDGQYLIGTSDPSSALFRYLAVKVDYRPRHFAPDDLLPLLPETLQPFVRTVGKRNLMVIHAPQERADEILLELQNADRPIPQVVLEAMVTVHSPETSYQFGMDLKQMVQDGSDRNLNAGLSGLALSGAVSPASLGEMFGDFGTTAYFLRCLEQEGYLDITAAPRVMAKDGEEAQISINRETFFSTQLPNGDVFFRQDIQKVDSGIVLQITPVIRGDMVTVTIKRAEVSEDIRETGTDPDIANPYPLINRRFVTTTVDVRDGETITIGGLTHRQEIDRESRVPLLGSIPGIGKLFRQIDKQNKESEVTVFISPRIVHPHCFEDFEEIQPILETDDLRAVAPVELHPRPQ